VLTPYFTFHTDWACTARLMRRKVIRLSRSLHKPGDLERSLHGSAGLLAGDDVGTAEGAGVHWSSVLGACGGAGGRGPSRSGP